MTLTLVTGGAGFLGTHLVRALLERGRRVVVLDDFSAPSDHGLPQHELLSVVVGDVRRPGAWEQALRHGRPEQLLHLASVVGVDAVVADPGRTESVIALGTHHALLQALAHGARLFVFSSSEVTDAGRLGPRAVYARAKRDAEQMLFAHAGPAVGGTGALPSSRPIDARSAAEAASSGAHDRLSITIVRPFNIVGPGQSAPGMVLPALARAARAGQQLPVHGDGRQERSFLHVEDLVAATLALLEAPALPGVECIEIGSEERTSIDALARRLGQLASGAGASARIAALSQPLLREDLPRRAPDLAALRRRIRFEPRWKLEQILVQALLHA